MLRNVVPYPRLLITDFDGTLTQRDFYECVLAAIDAGLASSTWQRFVAGKLTHFEALHAIFAILPGNESDVMRIARQSRLAPQLSDFVSQLHGCGWGVLVVSAGCAWYIERLLREQAVNLPVIANPGRLSPERGLELIAPLESPYYDPETGINKARVVDDALGQFEQVAFAGNGRADLEAARGVPAAFRFATGWLAEQLAALGEPFQPFQDWGEIAQQLCRD